jgi:hypothetical protein
MPYDVVDTQAQAFGDSSRLHRALAYFNRRRLTPGFPEESWRDSVIDDLGLTLQEGQFLAAEREGAQPLLSGVPLEPDAFVLWFDRLRENGPGQGDTLFPWLAYEAGREAMRWFLLQEVAGEAGFEDLVALTQVKMPVGPKLELARNYWDEMGRGAEAGMHGLMLGRLATALDIDPQPEATVWESLALANLMVGLASARRYAYQSIGALGVIELTAPGRAEAVARGLRRLGLDGRSRVYFELHATLDTRHSEAWNNEVLRPLVAACPAAAIHIAEGAIMRLRAGERCFTRYRRHFGLA